MNALLAIVLLGANHPAFDRCSADPSLACWEAAAAEAPDDAMIRNNYGASLLRAGRTDAALEQYYEAIRLDPKSEVAQFNIATTELSLKRPAIARGFAEEFLANHRDMPTAWQLAAKTYAALADAGDDAGLRRKAEDAWATACAMTPQQPVDGSAIAHSCEALARAQLERGEVLAAEASCDAGLRAFPREHVGLRRLRVEILHSQGKLEAALADAELLLENGWTREKEYARAVIEEIQRIREARKTPSADESPAPRAPSSGD